MSMALTVLEKPFFMADRMPRRQKRTFILSIEIILILLHRI